MKRFHKIKVELNRNNSKFLQASQRGFELGILDSQAGTSDEREEEIQKKF